jgi:hypothetical protein
MKADTSMHWFEEDQKATPLTAARRAGRYFHRKYGQVPRLIALPPEWESAIQAIEKELDGVEVVVDRMVLPRHVAVSAEQNKATTLNTQ